MTAATPIPAPEARPCYMAGVPEMTYHGDRTSVSSSTLKTVVIQTPAHARAELDEPRAETQAYLVGRGAHCRVFEPDRYSSDYVTAPKLDRRTKAGKAAWEGLLAAHPGAAVLTKDEGSTVEAIAAAVEAHPVAHHAIRGGEAELSGWYADAETGVPCRIRPDYLRVADGIMIDLKTTLDASPSTFQKSIHNLSYHLQAAMYAHGFGAITGERLQDFLFVAAEKVHPYAVAVYRLEQEALEIGLNLYRQALRTWADCLERDHWPAYSDHVESISLPAWALIRTEESDYARI